MNESKIMNRLDIGGQIKHVSQEDLEKNIDAFADQFGDDKVYVANSEGAVGPIPFSQLKDALAGGYSLYDDTQGYMSREDVQQSMQPQKEEKYKGPSYDWGWKGFIPQIGHSLLKPEVQKAMEESLAVVAQTPVIPGQTQLEYNEKVTAIADKIQKENQAKQEELARQMALPQTTDEIEMKITQINNELSQYQEDEPTYTVNGEMVPNMRTLFNPNRKKLTPQQAEKKSELEKQKAALLLQRRFLDKTKEYEEYDKGGDYTKLGKLFRGLAVNGDLQSFAVMGLDRMYSDQQFRAILDKAQKMTEQREAKRKAGDLTPVENILTPDEQKAMILYQNMLDIASMDRGSWFRAGEGLYNTFEFMRDMALAGMGGGFGSLAKLSFSQALKQTSKNLLKKGVEVAWKTPLLPGFYSNLSKNMTENYTIKNYGTNLKPRWYVGQKDSLGRTLYETWAQQSTEYFTEALGGALSSLGMLRRVAQSASKSFAILEKGANLYDRIYKKTLSSTLGKYAVKGLQSLGVDNAPMEFIEEIANVPLQSLMLGENQMGQLLDPRFYQEVAITTAALGGMGSAVQIMAGGTGAAIERSRSNKAIKDATWYIRTAMDNSQDDALKSMFNDLLTHLEAKDFYDADGKFTGQTIIDDINNIAAHGKIDKELFGKAQQLVKEKVAREGQTQALKAIMEDQVGKFEYGTSGDVVFGINDAKQPVFILDETEDAYVVNDLTTKETKMVPKSSIQAGATMSLDEAVTNYFVNNAFSRVETVQDVEQAKQEAIEQSQSAPLQKGSKATYNNQPVTVEDIFTDSNGQTMAIVSDADNNTHNVPLSDLVKADDITTKNRYILPDGKRAVIASYETDGTVVLNVLDDANNIVGQQTFTLDEFASFEKLPAQQANAIEGVPAQQPPVAPPQPAPAQPASPYKTDENGKRIWSSAPVEVTKAEIDSLFEGNDAVDYARAQLEHAQEVFDQAMKLTAQSLDPNERVAELKAINEQKQKASQELAYWQNVLDLYSAAQQQKKALQPAYDRIAQWEKGGIKFTIINSESEVTSDYVRQHLKSDPTITGWFDPKSGSVFIYMPNIKTIDDIDATVVHEAVSHKGLRALMGQERYDAFCQRVYDEVMTEQQRAYYMAYPGVDGNAVKAADEYIAYLSEKVNLTPDEQTVWDKIVEMFREALEKALNIILNKETITNEDIADLIRMSYANIKKQATPDVIHKDDLTGQALFSMRTYREGGRDKLIEFVDKRKADGALTADQAADIVSQMDQVYALCENYLGVYQPFGAWSEAEVAVDDSGKPVFSVIKANGDYDMNLDFSLVCKKRRTLDAVFDEMIRRGIISEYELGQLDIALINSIIRKYNFETACRLCFVDSRRFQVAAVADRFCALYNSLAVMNESQLDKVIAGEDKKTVRKKAAIHLKYNPQDRVLLSRDNFMSANGFEGVSINRAEVMKLYNSAKGTGGPKASLGDVQYLNDIIGKNWTPERAYAVGGVRLQSFSDYIPRMVFDYIQMIAELAAKHLPVHCYTKESIFVKQFGLTGIKINMSLVPRVDADGVAAGLDKDGNYAWQDGETFPYEEAIAIQNTPGYMENCGTIAVGVSDRHIRKMLSDENIRMIIPYHKSGLNKQVAIFNNIDKFTDYTKVQNTRYANGNALSAEDKANHFDFNGDLLKSQDPRGAAQRYLDWCDQNNYLPKFDQFRDHPNYYKLLEDFTTIVTQNGVDTVVPQGPVQMRFPSENDAFGSIASLIQQGLEEDAILEGRRSENLPAIVDEIQTALDEQKAAKKKAAAKKKGSKKKQDEIRFRSYDDRFNSELDDYKNNNHKGLLHLGEPGSILKACGINASELTLSPKVLNKHLERHSLTVDDLKGLAGAIQYPILVYKHGEKHPNIIVVTNKTLDDKKLSISVELDAQGNVVEVNNIASVHKKDAIVELDRLSKLGDTLRDNLRWVEKKEVLDWFNTADLNSPIRIDNLKLDSVTNVINSFENPTIVEQESSDQVHFRARTDEQKAALFDKSKEIFGTTNNFKVAGYMLPDGSLLDFSGKWEGGPGDRRYTDHRAIGSGLYDASEIDDNYDTDMYDFIANGAIRLMPEAAGIYVAQPLTEAQEDRLANFIYRYNGEVILEIVDNEGNSISYIEYNKRTSAEKVLSDIDNYFSKGIVPVQPEVRFRTSAGKEVSFEQVDITGQKLRELEDGEFCHVERIFTESKYFDFTAGEKIESANDVAYIFSQLEDESVENAFAVLVKDGKPYVIHIGMGGFDYSTFNMAAVVAADKLINADQVYMVHNHPSGALRASDADLQGYKKFRQAFGAKLQDGVIINLTSGKFAVFNEKGSGVDYKNSPDSEVPVKVFAFNKQVFDVDYNPQDLAQIGSSTDVASFISSHRLGDRAKLSSLILNKQNRVVGNVFLPFSSLDLDQPEINHIAGMIADYVIKMGGTASIVYGSGVDVSNRNAIKGISNKVKELSGQTVNILDWIHVKGNVQRYKSAADEGVIFRAGGDVETDLNSLNLQDQSIDQSNGLRDNSTAQKPQKTGEGIAADASGGRYDESENLAHKGNNANTSRIVFNASSQYAGGVYSFLRNNRVDFTSAYDNVVGPGNDIWRVYADKHNQTAYAVLSHLKQAQEEARKNNGRPTDMTLTRLGNAYRGKGDTRLLISAMKGGSNTASSVNTIDKNSRLGKRGIESGIFYSIDTLIDLYKRFNFKDPSIDALAARVFEVAKNLNIGVIFSNEDFSGYDVGFYAHNNTIGIKADYINSVRSAKEAKRVLLHETIHAVTTYALYPHMKRRLSPQMNAAADKLRDIYDALSKKDSFKERNGGKNVREMVAELADPDFREYLKSVGWFERIVRAIAHMFSSSIEVGTTKLEDIEKAVYQLLDSFDLKSYRLFNSIDNVEEDPISTAENNIRFRAVPVFQSNAEKATLAIKQDKATPLQWLAMLKKNGGLKAGEDKWIGLTDWLNKQEGTVTKQQVLDYIKENQIIVVDQVYIENDPTYIFKVLHQLNDEYQNAGWDTLSDKYPGFEDLFVVVNNKLDLAKDPLFDDEEYFDFVVQNKLADLDYSYKYINDTRLGYTTAGLDGKKEIALVVPSVRSWGAEDEVHFGDAGGGRAVAWARFGSAIDQNGNSVLVIDEVQSKRHQDAREQGYASSATDLRAERNRGDQWDIYRGDELVGVTPAWEAETPEQALEKYTRRNLVPDAPFEKNWHEVAMKRMLRYAAENGFDKIAWTTGQQQAERYDLAKVVDEIAYWEDGPDRYGISAGDSTNLQKIDQQSFSVKELEQTFGREIADKIINNEGVEDSILGYPEDENVRYIHGENMKVGGKGMEAFYDKMLVDFMNKYGKKWGVKVEDVYLPALDDFNGVTMHSVEVTDAMKDSVLNEPQVMFRSAVTPSDITSKGLRGTIGEDGFQTMVGDIVSSLPVLETAADIKRGITPEKIAAKMLDDYLDSTDDVSKGQDILFAIKDALTAQGGVIMPEDGELLYQLWKDLNPSTAVTIKEKLQDAAKAADVRFRAAGQRQAPATNEVKLTRSQLWQERLVDRMIAVKILYEQMKKIGITISDDTNPYITENLAMSRVQTEDTQFKKQIYTPLIDKVMEVENLFIELGLAANQQEAYKAVGEFLYARHAPERNKNICCQEVVEKMLRAIGSKNIELFKDANVRESLMAFASRMYNEKSNPNTPKTAMTFAKTLLKDRGADAQQQAELNAFRIRFVSIILTQAQEQMDRIFASAAGTNRSGMTDQDARVIMNRLYTPQTQALLDELSNHVRRATHFTIDTWLKYSLVNQQTAQNLKGMYRYYIPLRSWEEKEDVDYSQLASQAFNHASEIINLNRKAQGRKSKADDPLAYIASLAQSAIVVGNKNMIRLSLYRLIKANENNPALAQFATLPKVYYVETPGSDTVIAYDERPAQELFDQDLVRTKSNKSYKWHKSSAEYDAHIVPVILNGTRQMIELRGELGIKVASAINNTNVVHWQAANALKPVTNWLSAVRTSYNPEFVLVNFIRDFFFATTVYPTEGGSDAQLIKNLGHAFKSIHRLSTGKGINTQWDMYYHEFLQQGGQTGFFAMRNIDTMKSEIEDLHKLLGGKGVNTQKIKAFGENVAAYCNNMSESAMRLAVYITEREKGTSAKEAAYKAHEITVNFNRKGTWSGIFGGFYSFFNASVQGTARLFSWADAHKKQAAITLATMALAKLGAGLLAAAIGGDDYDELSDYVKFSNIVIPIGEDDKGKMKFLCIPMPQSIRAVTNISDNIVEVLRGNKTVGQAMGAQLANTVGEFLPLSFDAIDLTGRNTSYSIATVFAPTAIQPWMDVWVNMDFKGDPIYKVPFIPAHEGKVPEYKNVYGNANPVLVGTSRWLNRMAGGTDERSSSIRVNAEGEIKDNPVGYIFDWNPAKAEHLLNGYFGGLMSFPSNVIKTGYAMFSDEADVEYYNTPVINRFVKQPFYEDGYSSYYQIREMVQKIDFSIKAAKKTGDHKAAATIKKRNARLIKRFEVYDERVKQLQERLKKDNLSAEQRQTLQKSLDELVKSASEKLNEILKDEENRRD